MEKDKYYIIEYLPIARKDLQEIVDYITFDLEVPDIALKILDIFEASIESLRENPYRGSIYMSDRKHSYQYRKLFVKNYVIFYLIIDYTVEIQRIFYYRRNMGNLI